MLSRMHKLDRGDTLIEVLFAVTVFSLVAVTSISLMNQGTATSERALEITLVRQQIDAQAEALRFMHDSYVSAYQTGRSATSYGETTVAGQWALMRDSIEATATVAASSFGGDTTSCVAPPSGSFIIDTKNALFVKPDQLNYVNAPQFARLSYSTIPIQAQGLWIEAVRSVQNAETSQSNTGYIDFYIRACWDAVGIPLPLVLGTIVRLYEPRG